MAEHDPIGHLHTITTSDFQDVILDSLDGDEEFNIPLTILDDDDEDTLLLEDDRTSLQECPDHPSEDTMALSEASDSDGETKDGNITYVIAKPLCGS